MTGEDVIPLGLVQMPGTRRKFSRLFGQLFGRTFGRFLVSCSEGLLGRLLDGHSGGHVVGSLAGH